MARMDRIQAHIQTIRQHYPALEIRTAASNQDGQYNDVLVVDAGPSGEGVLVFRFARVPVAIQTLRHEIALQISLQDRLPLPIPEPVYTHVDTDVVGEAFVGYRMIPGRPLWREAFRVIGDAAARERMARQLADFLHALHHTPAEAIPVALPRHETVEEMADLYGRIRDRLFAHMRPDARRQVTAHFQPFVEAPDRYPFEPRLRHGDFGTGNILYDPETLSIAGILDFGSAGIGDPAVDFAGLFACYEEAFYRQCSAVYPEMEQALDRVHFYRGTFALQEALFGIENDDRGAFERGMAAYR
jgi:aminoglycoside 2''-phosphotransferase